MIARSLSYWLAVAALIGAIVFVSGVLRAAEIEEMTTAAATPDVIGPLKVPAADGTGFCAALTRIIETAAQDFTPIRGEQVDKKSWAGQVSLPGVGQCTVLDVLGPVYECRGLKGGWEQEEMLKAEILTLGRALDRCLLAGGRQDPLSWRSSAYRKSPPGYAKFYKSTSGRVQVFLGTNADMRQKGFYNSLRVEM
jgi:hypothetical protein